MGRIVVGCKGTKVRKSFGHLQAGGVDMITATSYVATVVGFSVEITVNSLPLYKGEWVGVHGGDVGRELKGRMKTP
ncbi:hypothetical protein NC651_032814 [Populus alba x Populus x berolinensis]|nr:hypothetical protein NC651_032814 [Populus alba x Populus x berolinensis]